jgi:FKBP-type peptidyl-prolyl cis-trans isomerase
VRRLLVGLALPALLVTAACSTDSGTPPAPIVSLSAVHVTGPTSAAPLVKFKAPIAFAKTSAQVIDPGPGTGPAVTQSSMVTVQYVAINAGDESVFGSSWKAGPSTFYVNSVVKGFAQGLIGTHAGDRVLIGVQAKDAFGPTGNLAATVRPGDSVIFVVDVEKVFPETPAPATAPTLVFGPDGNPAKFTAGPGVTKAPTKLGVYPLVEGDGPVVKSGDTVKVDYFGQIYPDQTVFNAWTGEPFPFQLGAHQVIDGWDLAITGQRVGTRLELVVPPSLGYKNKKQGSIPAHSTLVFAIEILSVN